MSAYPSIPADCAKRFEFKRWISAGGFGAVFLAHHRDLGRPAAIKLLFDSVQNDPSYVARFDREARLAASISHENVVKVLDAGSETGIPWIAYEFVDGTDLRSDRAGRSVSDVLEIMAAVASGVEQIHRKGIVHRDLKPENVLRAADGTCKITDFGIAKDRARGPMTQPGVIIGTPYYLAPEVIHGAPAQPSMDVYALGVMLFEMLSGAPPYAGENPADILRMHLEQQVPRIRAQRPGLPVSLEDLIVKTMAKNPQERPTIQEFHHELVKIMQSLREGGHPVSKVSPTLAPTIVVRPSPFRWFGPVLAGVLIFVLVAKIQRNERVPLPSPRPRPVVSAAAEDLYSEEAIRLWGPRLRFHVKSFWGESTGKSPIPLSATKVNTLLERLERRPDPEGLLREPRGLNLFTLEFMERTRKLKELEDAVIPMPPRMGLWLSQVVADAILLGDLTLDARRAIRTSSNAQFLESIGSLCSFFDYRRRHRNLSDADKKELAKLQGALDRWGRARKNHYMVTFIRVRAASAFQAWDEFLVLCKQAEREFPPGMEDRTDDPSAESLASFWMSLMVYQLEPLLSHGAFDEMVQLLERFRDRSRRYPVIANATKRYRGILNDYRHKLAEKMKSKGLKVPASLLIPF